METDEIKVRGKGKQLRLATIVEPGQVLDCVRKLQRLDCSDVLAVSRVSLCARPAELGPFRPAMLRPGTGARGAMH